MESDSDASLIAASFEEPGQFGALFDRHATVLFRYLVRRVGRDEADGLLGEVFRIAFEKRGTYDGCRPDARPWLYGIATNLVAKRRRSEARRIHATARLLARRVPPDDPTERVAARLDASHLWPRVADALTSLPPEERDALVLYAWEELAYEEIATALQVPVGTVRSRLNRARRRLRELALATGREPLGTTAPDRMQPDDPGDPAVLSQEKERLMATIDDTLPEPTRYRTPDVYPRLAYGDERAALAYLERVFGFTESREARMEHDGHMLAWLRLGDGVVMIGRANHDTHRIYGPREVGQTTTMINVYVHDIDAHYAHAVSEGAVITMELEDAFFGERRYEATDLEGHQWHFGERFDDIKERGGHVPDDA